MATEQPSPSAGSLFERLLGLSREAHAGRQFETAYHALTAAMHAADDAADTRALAVVAAEAEAQIEWIDRHAPAHRLSSSSSSQREHPGVYVMLARQTAAHLQMRAARSTVGG
jgi:hypothetical protein